jgi:hypothetical protein
MGCGSMAMLQCHHLRECIWNSEANDDELWNDFPRTSQQRRHEELVVSDASGLGREKDEKLRPPGDPRHSSSACVSV